MLSECLRKIDSGSPSFILNVPLQILNKMKKSVISVLLLMLLSMMAPPPQANAKPTFPFGLPSGFSFASFVGAGNERNLEKRSIAVKPYTGMRITNNSLIMIYWFDQTVAVAELGPKKLLLSCELIEVNNDEDRQRLLKDLSRMNRPLQISFPKMMKLMSQCQQVDGMEGLELEGRRVGRKHRSGQSARGNRGLLDNSPFTLFSGIIPGTKWCGTGDIAETYHDLGPERPMDRCCRTHDLCPVKVRAFSNRYNLTNNSIYSKSHCLCDDELFSCLKATNTSASQLMGNIYFNLVRVPCLEDDTNGKRFRDAKQGF